VIETMDHAELVTAGPTEARAGLLGVPMTDLTAGEGLPVGWHGVYVLERPAQAALGADGSPATGGMFTAPTRVVDAC
jgi:3-methylfumaryl-CoA hydratase